MFSGGDKSKSRGWKPYTRIDDRGENWNQLKNYWTGAPAPMGCVLGNAGVDWGKSKGKLPKVVRLIFGRSGLGLVWSVPGIPGSTGLCDPWENENSTFTLTFYLDFPNCNTGRWGPKREEPAVIALEQINKLIEQNRETRIRPYTYGQLISRMVASKFSEERKVSLIHGAGIPTYPCGKINLDSYLILYMKINLRWIISLNIKVITIKLLEENKEECVYDLGKCRYPRTKNY